MIAWMLGAALAGDLLAPTLRDLDVSIDRAAELAERAEVAEGELAAAQAAWVADGCVTACPRSRAVPLIVTARDAGSAWRTALQSARAELSRAVTMSEFASLRPLVDPSRSSRVSELRTSIERASRAYATRAAWSARWVEPVAGALGLPRPVCPPADAEAP